MQAIYRESTEILYQVNRLYLLSVEASGAADAPTHQGPFATSPEFVAYLLTLDPP